MAFVLGKDCKLYRNTGSYGSPTWDLVPNVKDLSRNFESSEANVTTRGNNGWEATIPALKRGGIDFGMVYDTADTDFVAFRDAFLNQTSLDLAIADGVIATTGTQYFRAVMAVTNFAINEPLEEAVGVDVSVKPTYSSNAPTWVTV